MGSSPSALKRWAKAGSFSAACTAALSRCAVAAGRPPGPYIANQALASIAMPCSRSVGTSGSCGARWAPATAITRTLPARCCSSASVTTSMVSPMWPPISAVIAGAPPWKGTCGKSMPAASPIIRPRKCGTVPLPEEP